MRLSPKTTRVGPGGIKPFGAPSPLGSSPAPVSPNTLGAGMLSSPTPSVVGAPKLPGAPGVRLAKTKKMVRPKRPPVPTANNLKQIPGMA